jgi:hypothetical protein
MPPRPPCPPLPWWVVPLPEDVAVRSGGWVAVLDHRRGVDVEDRCLGEGIARTDLIDELRGTVVCAGGPDRAKAKQRAKAQCHVVTGVAHGEWSVDARNYPNGMRRLQRVAPVGLEPTRFRQLPQGTGATESVGVQRSGPSCVRHPVARGVRSGRGRSSPSRIRIWPADSQFASPHR